MASADMVRADAPARSIAASRTKPLTTVASMPMASAVARGDRKSTRLNSSHTVISYAVFCSKKKKKLQRLTLAAMSYQIHRMLPDAAAKHSSVYASLERHADIELEARSGRAIDRRSRSSRLQ